MKNSDDKINWELASTPINRLQQYCITESLLWHDPVEHFLFSQNFHVFLLSRLDYELEISITHRNRERIVQLFWYKSTSRSKLYINPLHRHFDCIMKGTLLHYSLSITELIVCSVTNQRTVFVIER